MENIGVHFGETVDKNIRDFMLRVLNSVDLGKKLKFIEKNKRTNADISAGIFTPAEIEKLGKKFRGLSVAETSGPKPRRIWFNRENFLNPPEHFSDPIQYRRYLVLHEFLHALGLHHVEVCNDCKCSIMTPQTFKPNCKINSGLTKTDKEYLIRSFNL